ncbi:hypothetical protein [Streptomyces sp. CS090A]|uniref:hypothetical protein n=1 Tax=Streptomyces sp. CS090A TaxID=2162710 RepID=UPI0013A54072|nr:hypothetical protein [Streptomyces sp. CS090A]
MTADPRQPAYDAVFAYIRSQPDVLPATVVERNAIIWRAVNAALDAVLPASDAGVQPPTANEEDTVLAAAIPEWEAVYEPGNVSDYLIGYANTEAAAKGAAIAWVFSQTDRDASRLDWYPQTWSSEHDEWFDLFERHDDGIDTCIGVTVRHRLQPYTAADFTPDGAEQPAVPAAPEATGTPCGPMPDTCDAEAGDPCRKHELEQAHGEGEHAFCGPECSDGSQAVSGGEGSERLALVEALVADFIDPDPCHFDHHGYCQAHGWFATDPGCPHGRAKALGLEETEEASS